MRASNKVIIFLIALGILPLFGYSQNEKFDEFIHEFCNDSVFQVSRVKFPLLCLSWDMEVDKEIEIYIKKEAYRFDRLFYNNQSDGYTVFYDNFDLKIPDTDEMVFRYKGFTDMDIRYYFKRTSGKWFLIRILDYDMEE